MSADGLHWEPAKVGVQNAEVDGETVSGCGVVLATGSTKGFKTSCEVKMSNCRLASGLVPLKH